MTGQDPSRREAPDQRPGSGFVGRRAELDLFARTLAMPGMESFLLFGPSGIGKTRLAEECLAAAAASGRRCLRASAGGRAAGIPLGALAPLLPREAVRTDDPVQVFAAASAVLSAPSGERVVVFVDDLHLLDPASVALLVQLTRSGHVFVLGTARSAAGVAPPAAALDQSDRSVRVDLCPFDADGVEAFLEAELDGPVERQSALDLADVSHGNALYLRELVRGARAAGALSRQGGLWRVESARQHGTPRLMEMIAARIARAPAAARPALEALAACGPLELAALEALVPYDVLVALEGAALIQVRTDGGSTTAELAHPLYAEALEERLPNDRRRAILRAEARRILDRGISSAADALRVAGWLLEADGTADADLLLRAASLARHAHDYRRVIALSRAALDSGTSDATRARALHGEALFQLGQHTEAEKVLAGAEELARGAVDRAAGPQERERAENLLLTVVMDRTQNLFFGLSDQRTAREITRAARPWFSSAAHLTSLTLNESALRAGRTDVVLRQLENLEEEPCSPRVRLFAASMQVMSLAAGGRATEARQLGRRAFAEHQELDERTVILHPTGQSAPLVVAHLEAGMIDEARRTGEEGFSWATEDRALQPQIWIAWHLGRCELVAGRVRAARRWYLEALALAGKAGVRFAERTAWCGLAVCEAQLGNAAEARAAADAADACSEYIWPPGEDVLASAWATAAEGDMERAVQQFLAGARRARETGNHGPEGLLLMEAVRLGAAKSCAPRLREIAELSQGLLAPVRARMAEAIADARPEELEAAAEAAHELGADLLAAEGFAVAAALWRRSGKSRMAQAASNRAAALTALVGPVSTPALRGVEHEPLTSREQEVTCLAAGGRTSQEIAAELFLSVRTVDNHLQRAYGKLGVTSRTELARVLGQESGRPRS
ncbi:LuxR C-terminal-related transcriptional regulator [Streptomyces sp. NPDC005805]|uniref:helix-turn-helix transcriptional regulator n=1 Tax=Streptomyces sp. NPDC005805 TaxID=3157068 RepID=UPI0033E6E220